MQQLKKAGKYLILSRIGMGGFGVVYEGRDPFIKRRVAIKTCTAENADVRRRFLREAEIAGNLVHPNITLIYDFGFQDDTPYLVQEYLNGEDLGEKISRRDEIPLEAKLDFLIQIAQALGFAHSQGVTHRDIKPSNVRILDSGQVKIMDFGIAKISSAETQLTQTGTTLGTPAYLSPEQLRGDEVDSRSDIYSFGALAFELLTYRRLFAADTISALFFQILNQRPSHFTENWSKFSTRLEELVERCVEKQPGDRVASFHEIEQALIQVKSARRPSPAATVESESDKLGRAEIERQHAINETRETIDQLLDQGMLSDAADALQAARSDFGEVVTFRTVAERLDQLVAAARAQSKEQSAELEGVVERVRELTAEGRLVEAQQAHDVATAEFPEGPSLISAGRQLRVRKKLAEAREALVADRLDEADEAARRAQELDPEAEELSEILGLIAQRTSADAAEDGEPERVTAATTRMAPSQKELDDTATTVFATRTESPTAPRSVPRWLLAAIALGLAITAAVFVFWVRDRPAGGAQTGLGTLVLDSRPWGRVTAIVDADGNDVLNEISPSGPPITPFSLALPAGSYQLTLDHPASADPVSLEVVVGAGQKLTQRVQLAPVNVDDYFRQQGLDLSALASQTGSSSP